MYTCDDTDVFVLLIHLIDKMGSLYDITMESPLPDRSVIDTRPKHKHKKLAKYLLAGHALTGCDMSYLYGIGKVTMVEVLDKGLMLQSLGQVDSEMADVITESSQFITNCYGSKPDDNMFSTCYSVWT